MCAGDTLSWALTAEIRQKLERTCLTAVRLRRCRPGYGLLREEDLVQMVFSRACLECQGGGWPADDVGLQEKVARLALTVYSEALYHGCCSAGAEQNRAYTELAAYLYRIAYSLVSAAGRPVMWAEDYVQDALQTIWQRIAGCREPGAFLRWSTVILIRVAQRGLGREREHLPMPEED